MNKNLIRVEEFDLAALKAAFLEGRLYILVDAKSDAQIREEGITAILQYVSRIDACAQNEYLPHIHTLWNRILHDEVLLPLCFMQKGKRRGLPNWYRITNIVCVLREWEVYRSRDFSAVRLHLLLEQIDKRNAVYESATHYFLDHREMGALRKIVRQVKEPHM